MRSTVETSLTAREIAVLKRERAADRREAEWQAMEQQRAHNEMLRDANERLVLTSLQAHSDTLTAQQLTEALTFKAERDFLTGLPNRALLADRLERSIALAERHAKKVAVMFLDVDHFKEINDAHGHLVGDKLLQSTAQRLEECVRKSDTVSRQGGDEFVVLLNEVGAGQDAAITADKLLKVMAVPHLIGDHRLSVTMSIGISLYPDDGKNVEAILTNADAAMYHAKKSGRNTFRRFTPEMESALAAQPCS